MSLRDELIEAGANAIYACEFDHVEVRDWGRKPLADPERYLTVLALDAFLDKLAEEFDERDRLVDVIAVLRDGAETRGEGT